MNKNVLVLSDNMCQKLLVQEFFKLTPSFKGKVKFEKYNDNILSVVQNPEIDLVMINFGRQENGMKVLAEIRKNQIFKPVIFLLSLYYNMGEGNVMKKLSQFKNVFPMENFTNKFWEKLPPIMEEINNTKEPLE